MYNLAWIHNSDNFISEIKNKYENSEDAEKAVYFLQNLIETRSEVINNRIIDESVYEKGITAWDVGRLTVIARLCMDKGYIDKTKTLEYIEYAYNSCKEVYSSWRQLAEAYMLGRIMWGGLLNGFDGIKVITDGLLEDKESPWFSSSF